MIGKFYALINLIKAMIGVGVFALPVAFQQAGLWVATVLVFALGFVNAHSMLKLVRCSQYLSEEMQLSENTNRSSEPKSPESPEQSNTTKSSNCDKWETSRKRDTSQKEIEFETDAGEEENRVALDYGDMAEQAFLSRESECLKKLGKPFKVIVNISIIFQQIGFCSTYFIFVVDHTKEVIDYFFSTDISRNMLFFAVLPFFFILATVRSIVVLTWIGFLGNVLVTGAIAIIVVQMLPKEHIPLSNLPAFTNVEGATFAAGSIIYAYAAHGVVLPLENRMRKPHQMLGFFGVISISNIFIGTAYFATGFLGYITYGENLKGSITLNLTNSPIDFSVKLMLLVMTYCGYLIQSYPIIEMILPSMKKRLKDFNICVTLLVEYVFRYLIAMTAFGFAYVIPQFKHIIPFVGVTVGMALALFFPPLLEILVFLDQWKRGSTVVLLFKVSLNMIYMVLGILSAVIGVFSNYKIISNRSL